ncbi:hypothetical protein ABPG75_003609 [Micractinium tetrahymenae]
MNPVVFINPWLTDAMDNKQVGQFPPPGINPPDHKDATVLRTSYGALILLDAQVGAPFQIPRLRLPPVGTKKPCSPGGLPKGPKLKSVGLGYLSQQPDLVDADNLQEDQQQQDLCGSQGQPRSILPRR